MRLAVGALDQVAGERLDPIRIDAGRSAQITLRRLDCLGRHYPTGSLLEQRGAGPEIELVAASTGVLIGLAAIGDVGEQAGEDGTVDGNVGVIGDSPLTPALSQRGRGSCRM